MSDRDWTWTAAIAAIAGTAYSSSGWCGIIALILVWTLVTDYNEK